LCADGRITGAGGSVARADSRVGGADGEIASVDRAVGTAGEREDGGELIIAAGAHSILTPGRSGLVLLSYVKSQNTLR